MQSQDVQVLSAGRQTQLPRSPGKTESELWISAADLAEVTGWQLKPQGLCKDSLCMIVGPDLRQRAVDGEAVCASALWEGLGRPVLHDQKRSVWMLGEAAADRQAVLETLQAPDFTLPDHNGVLHSLSDYRGQKVLLATWATW